MGEDTNVCNQEKIGERDREGRIGLRAYGLYFEIRFGMSFEMKI